MKPEKEIHSLFIEKKWTLSLAESCTGGALAYRLVQLADCSCYFLGSVVAYSNKAKTNLLDVREETLEKQGAVSEQTAEEMVLGAIKRFQSDYAIATTGIAGPEGGSWQKPVGTLCFALAKRDHHLFSWTSCFEGEREAIIDAAVREALQQLLVFVSS